MRLLSLLVLVAALPSCRCNKEEPRPVDAAPTASTAPIVEEDVWDDWDDATSHPGKMKELTGLWGERDKKPWAYLYSADTWAESSSSEWSWPYSHYLIVESEGLSFECGFWSANMGNSYCIVNATDDSPRRVLPLTMKTRREKNDTQMRITVGENRPVVVVRHATP